MLHFVFRITLQVTDVLRLRIRALRSKDQQPQNVVEENSTRALSTDCCFLEPEGANSARSCYRLLCEVQYAFYFSITFSIIILSLKQ